MDKLCELRSDRTRWDEIASYGRQVWHLDSRDDIQVAVAQLFGVVATQLDPPDKFYIFQLGVGTTWIAKGEGYPDWVLSTALEEFQVIEQQRQQGVRPSEMLNLVGVDHYGFFRRKLSAPTGPSSGTGESMRTGT